MTAWDWVGVAVGVVLGLVVVLGCVIAWLSATRGKP